MIKTCTRHFLFLIITIFTFISCNQNRSEDSDRSSSSAETFNVGVSLTLTGPASNWGNELRKGLEFGFNSQNQKSDGPKINVQFEDNKFNPKEAVSIARKFTELDKMDLVIAGYTPIVRATTKIINQKQIPMVATLTSASNIASELEWIFRDFVLESTYMPVLAEFAYNKENFHHGAYLVINDDFGLDARHFFIERFMELGGLSINGEVFETTDLDMRNKVNKLLAMDPEFILLVGRGSAMINACRQIREVSKDIRIYSSSSINNKTIWQGLGSAGDGIVFPTIAVDEDTPGFIEVNEAFKSIYQQDMNWVNTYGYTIANYLTDGFTKAGKDKEALKSYLKNLDFISLRGHLLMNENSDVITPVDLYKRENGYSINLEH